MAVTEDRFAKMVELGTKLTALLATASLVGSVIYDWAYLRELGLDFANVPTSLADHVRSSLLWIPLSAVGACAGLLIELGVSRLEGWRREEEIIAASLKPERTRKFRRAPYIFITTLGYLDF